MSEHQQGGKSQPKDTFGHFRLKFKSIDTIYGDDYPATLHYPLIRVWFTTPNEDKSFSWVPKWKDLYEILHEAVQIERKNFPHGSWNELLTTLEQIFLRGIRLPAKKFYARRRRLKGFVGASFQSAELMRRNPIDDEDRELLEKIRRFQSGEHDEENDEEGDI